MNNCPCSEFRLLVDVDIPVVMEYLKKAKYLESNHNIVAALRRVHLHLTTTCWIQIGECEACEGKCVNLTRARLL